MTQHDEILGFRVDGSPIQRVKPGGVATAAFIHCHYCKKPICSHGGPAIGAWCMQCWGKKLAGIMVPMVLKIQRPIGGNMGMALLYNEDRSLTMQVPVEEVRNLFDNGELKVYYTAMFDQSKGTLEVLDYVEKQPNW